MLEKWLRSESVPESFTVEISSLGKWFGDSFYIPYGLCNGITKMPIGDIYISTESTTV